MADWEPELYHRFRRYRAEPVELIFARLHFARGAGERIVDLGCGTGEHTVELARRSGGHAHGIDSSPAMIDKANELRAALDPELRARVAFVREDIRDFSASGAYTTIFSNAALQWLGDHRAILKTCFDALVPGGEIAIQMPANERETAQATIAALAAEPKWRERLGGAATPSRENVAPPETYREILTGLGFAAIDCFHHTFAHPMDAPAEVVEWSRATALRPFLSRLPVEAHEDFVSDLTRRLETAYGTSGPLTFNFRRLFIFAQRPAV
jgi:trans-aconitate 2-methyltransferase